MWPLGVSRSILQNPTTVPDASTTAQRLAPEASSLPKRESVSAKGLDGNVPEKYMLTALWCSARASRHGSRAFTSLRLISRIKTCPFS